MNKIRLLLIVVLSLLAQESKSITSIVDKQIDAYNNKDIDAFAKTYHDSIEIYDFPNRLKYKGKKILIQRYGDMFKKLKKLQAKSLQRMTLGNKLVDYEQAEFYYRNELEPDVVKHVIVIYEVTDGLISKVLFSR